MSVQTPVYEVRFYSGSTLKHGFGYGWTNKVLSLKIRPGLTSAIGSFEITLPDTGSSGEFFADINPYEDVHIWYGYSYKGSYDFKGKIDTINVGFSPSQGHTRTFIGRDYGEALFRALIRRSYGYSPYERADQVVIDIRDKTDLSADNRFIEAPSLTVYPLTLSNDSAFGGIEEISDFDNRDFYVDTSKKLHWFERQTKTGPETFSADSNIFRYRLGKDVTDVKNRYYVFGIRDPANITGSDWPASHDDWTEPNTTGWYGYISGNEIYRDFSITNEMAAAMTGSYCINANGGTLTAGGPYEAKLRLNIPNGPVRINDGDTLHFYLAHDTQPPVTQHLRVRLETSTNNYYETRIESIFHDADTLKHEKTLPLGPTMEGYSVTGSRDSDTGSYKWTRTGNPDWYNINRIRFMIDISWLIVDTAYEFIVDGLFFGTRFQTMVEDVPSQTAYGLRPEVEISSKYNSKQYCQNVGNVRIAENKDITTQVEIITTGSPDLKMGYTYALTIPAENISSQDFELIGLEHRFDKGGGFTSRGIFTDKPQLRTIIPIFDYPAQQAREGRRTTLSIARLVALSRLIP